MTISCSGDLKTKRLPHMASIVKTQSEATADMMAEIRQLRAASRQATAEVKAAEIRQAEAQRALTTAMEEFLRLLDLPTPIQQS